MKAKIPCEQGTHRKQASYILHQVDWDRCANELEASRDVIDHISTTLDQAENSLNNTLSTAREIVEVLQ